jgi:hypothetical protein
LKKFSTKDNDDYYISIGSEPPRFAYYRHYRIENSKDEWRKIALMAAYDSIIQDELDYNLRAKLRVSPEERYQSMKKEPWFHDSSYRMRWLDAYDGSGCNQFTGCVPECCYYPEYGRIEDDEVITEHRELEQEHRKCNEIVNIDISPNGDNYNDYQKFLKMWDQP